MEVNSWRHPIHAGSPRRQAPAHAALRASSLASTQLGLSVTEPSQVAAARRYAAALAQALGFTEAEIGQIALAVTEVATNLVKHATNGQLLLRGYTDLQGQGIELLALDGGPGIVNVAACLQDGFSTAGSPGIGLGVIGRICTRCDIYSRPGSGTALLACCQPHRRDLYPLNRSPTKRSGLDIGVICLPVAGETVCGDAWAIDQQAGHYRILVADGLGHGPEAGEAAQEAVRVFHMHPLLAPAAIIDVTHTALRGTRGVALAVADIDLAAQQLRFAGVGNIAGAILTPEGHHSFASHNGIVGYQIRQIQEFSSPWHDCDLLLMHSDGLASRWDLAAYPGLAYRHPGLIAGVLYRDYSSARDDVTIVAATAAKP